MQTVLRIGWPRLLSLRVIIWDCPAPTMSGMLLLRVKGLLKI